MKLEIYTQNILSLALLRDFSWKYHIYFEFIIVKILGVGPKSTTCEQEKA